MNQLILMMRVMRKSKTCYNLRINLQTEALSSGKIVSGELEMNTKLNYNKNETQMQEKKQYAKLKSSAHTLSKLKSNN